MRAPLPAVALLALLAVSATSSLGAPPGPPVTRAFAWDVTAVACGGAPDGLCLAYDGRIPGPTLDVNLGDTVVITLRNRIAETLPEGAPSHLASTPVSFHVHGTSISADNDGVLAHEGTRMVESVAHPNGSFTYTFRAAFKGTWHYHDHVLGHDGAEGTARGLFGALVVRSGAEPRPTSTLDLHVHDAGVNVGHGVAPLAPLAAGDTAEFLLVGLGNRLWTVTIADPAGVELARRVIGPGMSESVIVPALEAGAYAWRAQWGPFVHQGEVVVT